MDITQYKAAKEKGTAAVKKYGSKLGIETRTFDPVTGEQNPPAFQELYIDQLAAQAAANRAAADAIDGLIADLRALG